MLIFYKNLEFKKLSAENFQTSQIAHFNPEFPQFGKTLK